MLKKKTKIIILTAMVLLLGVTGYLNITLNNKVQQTSTNVVTSANYFATYREDRQATRDQELLYYDAIIANESSSEEAKKDAENKKMAIVEQMESELVIEGLIKAKGFEECVAVISGDKANIVVKSEGLKPNQLSQILEIVYLQADIVPANVTISEK